MSPSAESVLSITSHAVGQPSSSSARPVGQMAHPPLQTAPRPAAGQQPVPPHTEDGEPADNDDQDGGRYCYCQGPSYGEMVGCDDEHCAYEWVRAFDDGCCRSVDACIVPLDMHRFDRCTQGGYMVLRRL